MSVPGTTTQNGQRSENIFHLQQAFKLAISLVLFYWIALLSNWDEPQYGALAIVIVSLGTTGASIKQGLLRVVGTTFGVAFGILILGLFQDDRWAMMLALSIHITVIGYFMQASRYPYAWYMAAFLPLVVWGDNYPKFESAFYFGTFRWLQTTVGVVIYTVVDMLFWPRRAGDQLNQQGQVLWRQVQELFGNYRQQLEQGHLPSGTSERRAKLAGTLSETISSLQDSYFDTPNINARKRLWEVWRNNVQPLVDGLELWRESIDDCRQLDLEELLPQLGPALHTLEKRFERFGELWQTIQPGDNGADTDDSQLAKALSVDVDRAAYADLAQFERAALMDFVGQVKLLDQASLQLLQAMRILANLEPGSELRVESLAGERHQSSLWDSDRLIHALFPPVAFIATFFFWIYIYLPPGAKVPMWAGILSLVLLRTPMNPLPLLVTFVLSILFVVAPIYWLVMPGLSTSLGILGLIFVYAFVFGYLGGRSPALKSGPLMMFAVMTGISNQQSYSFQGPVDGALMIVLAGSMVTVVYFMLNSMRPEQQLLRGLRRFFHGCAQVTGGFALDGRFNKAKGRRNRKRCFESLILPAPGKILTAKKHLDYRAYPDNGPDKVQRLHDSLQSVVYRLQSVEIVHDRIARQSPEFPASLVSPGQQVSEIVQRVFERWKHLEPGDVFEQQRSSLEQLSHDLHQQLNALETRRDRDSIRDRVLTDLYTLLGALRGLIDSMANTQHVINQINWQQWAAPRF